MINMAEENSIGPTDRTAEASVKRFEARQKHKESSEGQLISTVRRSEKYVEKEESEKPKEPDKVEVEEGGGFLGLRRVVKKTWFKKKNSPDDSR